MTKINLLRDYQEKNSGASRRAKASQTVGKRFEKYVINTFRNCGLECGPTSELEVEGFLRGWDVQLHDLPDYAIQCKRTGNPRSLLLGLDEAIKHNPNAAYHICIHNYRPKTWNEAGRIHTIRQPKDSKVATKDSLDGLISWLLKQKQLEKQSK